MKRILGLDLGTARTGAALSDERQVLASPLAVWSGTLKQLAARISALPEPLETVVIGLPLNPDGSDSQQSRAVRKVARRLAGMIAVPIELFDETLSTATAEEPLLAAGLSRARRKELRDRQAAVVILQAYLDRKREPDAK